MIVVGASGVLLPALSALGLAAVTAWAGWRAAVELRQGYRSHPPGAADLALAIAGVALPVAIIVVFAALLAVALVRIAV